MAQAHGNEELYVRQVRLLRVSAMPLETSHNVQTLKVSIGPGIEVSVC